MTATHMTIFEGLPGSGKTFRMLREMISSPGKYILAAPRTALVEEHIELLKSLAARSEEQPTTSSIHSDQGVPGPVQRRIKDACRELQDVRHVVLGITHEGLQSLDPAALTGWHIRIDEAPDAVASGQIRVPVGARWLETLYELREVEGTKWSKVVPKDDAPSIGHFLRDDLANQELATFHKRAISVAGLYVDITAWADATDRHKPIRWLSLWTPRDLAGCASIKIAASGYETSLCAAAVRFMEKDVECYVNKTISLRSGQPDVRIHYFTRHRGSTEFWKKGAGRECLAKVGRYLDRLPDLGFWSGNEIVRDRFELLRSGQRLLPRQAGTNSYRHLTSCAIIYSNKAQDADSAILEVIDLTRDQIARAREIEDIQQFVMRGAIRNPDFAGRYDIYVYDLQQAEAVRDFLVEGEIFNVSLHGVEDAGLMEIVRPKSGRKPADADDRSKAERDAERRQKDAARKVRTRSLERERRKAAGTDRKPGRPRRESPTTSVV